MHCHVLADTVCVPNMGLSFINRHPVCMYCHVLADTLYVCLTLHCHVLADILYICIVMY